MLENVKKKLSVAATDATIQALTVTDSSQAAALLNTATQPVSYTHLTLPTILRV